MPVSQRLLWALIAFACCSGRPGLPVVVAHRATGRRPLRNQCLRRPIYRVYRAHVSAFELPDKSSSGSANAASHINTEAAINEKSFAFVCRRRHKCPIIGWLL